MERLPLAQRLIPLLGQRFRWTIGTLVQGHLEHLGQVQCAAAGEAGDLFAATEAVGDDERIVVGLAHGGQQHPLADGHARRRSGRSRSRTSRPCRSSPNRAARSSGPSSSGPHSRRQRHDVLVMAMPLHQGLALELRADGNPAPSCSRNSLRMKVWALSRLASSSMGKRFMQLVAEDGHAARFEPDERACPPRSPAEACRGSARSSALAVSSMPKS